MDNEQQKKGRYYAKCYRGDKINGPIHAFAKVPVQHTCQEEKSSCQKLRQVNKQGWVGYIWWILRLY